MIGFFQYTLGNALLFWALKSLPATAGSLALSLTPIPALLLGIIWLRERPTRLQLLGIIGAIGGSVLFFSAGLKPGAPLALGLLGIAVLSLSIYPVLARELARGRIVDNVILTGLPLFFGGGLLLIISAGVEGIPHLPLPVWGILIGLALVNTLAAYLWFNYSLQHLRAFEANTILNLAPLGTALIAWGTLGEQLLPVQIAAMLVVVGGTTLVQKRRPSRRNSRIT
jgi:drug/metabolite transporter (DMT)-like permease